MRPAAGVPVSARTDRVGEGRSGGLRSCSVGLHMVIFSHTASCHSQYDALKRGSATLRRTCEANRTQNMHVPCTYLAQLAHTLLIAGMLQSMASGVQGTPCARGTGKRSWVSMH